MSDKTEKLKHLKENKWNWKMDYCKNRGLAPAQDWAWNEAEAAYQIELKKQEDENK